MALLLSALLLAGSFPGPVFASETAPPAAGAGESAAEELLVPDAEITQEPLETSAEALPEEIAAPLEVSQETDDAAALEETVGPALQEVSQETDDTAALEETAEPAPQESSIEELPAAEPAPQEASQDIDNAAAWEETAEPAPQEVSQEVDDVAALEGTEEPAPQEASQETASEGLEEPAQEPEEPAQEPEVPEDQSGDTTEELFTLTYDANGGKIVWTESILDEDGNYIGDEERESETYSESFGEGSVIETPFTFTDEVSVCPPDGMKLVGWSLERDGEAVDFSDFQMPAHDCTLYALWEKPYTLTFDANGDAFSYIPESAQEGDQQAPFTAWSEEHVEGSEVDLDSPPFFYGMESAGGKLLAGWSEDVNGEPLDPSYTMPARDVTLYAVWTDAYEIILDANGGKLSGIFNPSTGQWDDDLTSARILVEEGSPYYLPEPYIEDSKKGFLGWSLEKDGEILTGADEEFYPDGDCTLYAVWEDDPDDTSCKITLNANGGYFSEEGEDVTEVTLHTEPWSGINLSPQASDVRGIKWADGSKVLAGWSLEKDGERVDEDFYFEPESSCTLYAIWAEGHTLTYDANGQQFPYVWDPVGQDIVHSPGTSWTEECAVGDGPSIIEFQMMSTEGKLLAGWSEEKDGDRIDPYSFVMPDHDVTLYAVWAEAYEVTLDANGGYFSSTWNPMTGQWEENLASVKKYIIKGEGSSLEGPDTEDSEKGLAGWSLEKDGEIALASGETYYPEKDITLYAVWNGYTTVTFDANGGYFGDYEWDAETEEDIWVEKPTKSYTEIKGSRMSFPEPESHDGKFLRGWSIEKGGAVIEEGNYPVPDTDTTFYAVWEMPLTAVFDANGGYYEGEEWDPETDEYVPVQKQTWTMNRFSGEKLGTNPVEPGTDQDQRFRGWSRTRGGDVENINFYELRIYEDMTFYAVWEDPLELTFDANGGYFDGDMSKTRVSITGFPDTLYEKDDEVSDPALQGKVFAGWSVNADGSQFLGMSPYDYYEKILKGDTTLYAVWKDACKVTLEAGEGSFSDGTQRMETFVGKGEAYRLPVLSAPSGRRFAGWKDSATGCDVRTEVMETHPGGRKYYVFEAVMFSTVITEDSTFVAVYEDEEEGDAQVTGSVILDANGGTFKLADGSSVQETEVFFNSIYSINIPDSEGPDGRTIACWSLDPEGRECSNYLSELISDYQADHDRAFPDRIYAVWSDSVNLILETDEGSFTSGEKKYESEMSLGGYVDLGYSYETQPAVENDGRILTGWKDTASGEIYTPSDEFHIYRDMTLKAVWEDAFKISFDAGNGGYFDGDQEKTSYWYKGKKGDPLSCYGVDESGYRINYTEPENRDPALQFDAWITEDGKRIEKDDIENFIPDRAQTLKASYKTRKIWKVTFDANGGQFDNDGTMLTKLESVAEQGREVELPGSYWTLFNPDSTKVLLGWSLDEEGKRLISDSRSLDEYVPQADCTIYAVWADTYGVTFDHNGGACMYSSEKTETFRIPVGKPMSWYDNDWAGFCGYYPYNDYVLTGWSYSKTGKVQIKLDDLPSFVPDRDVTLYAVYEKSVDIILDAKEGRFFNDYGEACGKVIFKMPKGARFLDVYPSYADKMPSTEYDKKIFKNWTDVNGSVVDPENLALDSDSVFYANYEEGYEITFDPGRLGEYIDPYENYYNKGFTRFSDEAICFTIKKGETLDRVHSMAASSLVNYFDHRYDDLDVQPSEEDRIQKPVLWFTDSALTNRIDPDSYIPEGDTTLYAGWSANKLIETIKLDAAALTLNKGKKKTIRIQSITPADATDKTVKWTSANEKIAAVDQNGVITATGKGTTTITAAAADGSGRKATCRITVKVPVTKITLDKTALTLVKGKTAALKVKTVTPSDANNKSVTWTSSNKKIVTVDTKGNIKAIGKGTAVITAAAKDGSKVTATCKITVKVPVTKITLNKTALTINKGKTANLKVKAISPADASNKAVTWTSSNKKVATVNAKGVVKAVGKGTATITATAKDGSRKKAACKVTVRQPVTRLTINKTTAALQKGKTMTLKAVAAPSNADNKKVKWTTSNKNIATVTQKGVVKGIKKGTVTITATATDGSGKKVTCKVTVK